MEGIYQTNSSYFLTGIPVSTLVQRPTIEALYRRFLEAMTENQFGSLLEKPHLIFNGNESGFEFDVINKIIAAAKGMKHVPRISKGAA